MQCISNTFSIPQEWIRAGVVLGQGKNTKSDLALKEKLDKIFNDQMQVKYECEAQRTLLGDKPHVFTHETIPGKVIKLVREDAVRIVKDPVALNAKRVGEALKFRKIIEKKGLQHVKVPREVLYSRFDETTKQTHYAVVADKVDGLVQRVLAPTSSEPLFSLAPPQKVKPLTRAQLVDLLACVRENGRAIDFNPDNLPLHGGKVSLIDLEPILEGILEKGKHWARFLQPWNLSSSDYNLTIFNLGLLKKWNVASADQGLVNKEIRRVALKGLAKTVASAAAFILVGVAAVTLLPPLPAVALAVAKVALIWTVATASLNSIRYTLFIVNPSRKKRLSLPHMLKLNMYKVEEGHNTPTVPVYARPLVPGVA